jgi:hypothetical protein
MAAEVQRSSKVESDASLHSKRFTSWKFGLIDGMLSDPDMSPVDFRIAIALLQRVNQFTKKAAITDAQLQQLLHCDRKALMKARRRLSNLGWLKVRTGRYGRATEYQFFDERATLLDNIRLDEQILASEAHDNEARTPLYGKTSNEAETPHSGKQHRGMKTPHTGAEPKTLHSGLQWGENARCSGANLPPLHLQTPRRESLPLKNRALEAYEAHVFAFERWTEFEETAAYLETGQQLPRPEAEHRARILCGFDDADAGGRQGDRSAPPTMAKHYSEEGISNDQDNPYHDL